MKIQKSPFKIKAIVPFILELVYYTNHGWLAPQKSSSHLWILLTIILTQATYTHKQMLCIYMYVVPKCHLQVVLLFLGEFSPWVEVFLFTFFSEETQRNNCLLCFLIPNCAAQNNGIQRHQNAREERKVTPMERPNQGQDVSWLDEEGEDGGGIAGGTGEKERQSIEISLLMYSLVFDRRGNFLVILLFVVILSSIR